MLLLMEYITNCTVYTGAEQHPLTLENNVHVHEKAFRKFYESADFLRYLVIKSPYGFWTDGPKYTFRELIDQGWKIISMIRDPRDVATSRNPFKEEFEYVWDERSWADTANQILDNHNNPGLEVVHYEDLAHLPQGRLKAIAKFLGESVKENYENFYKADHCNNWQPLNGARPIDTKSIGRWHKPEHAEQIRKTITPEITKLAREFGYNL